MAMTRIAHVSDLHLVEVDHDRRTGLERRRLSFLCFGRTIDYDARRARVVHALRTAMSGGADHVVITGDLTEDGVAPQFEVLADTLRHAGLCPSRVTLVPGNHDAYTREDALETAIAGPLREFEETSGAEGLSVLDGVVVLPVSTARHQSYARSAGHIDREGIGRIAKFAEVTRRMGRALVVAQHHPALGHPIAAWNYWDGLLGHRAMRDLLDEHPHVHVVHGHTHKAASERVVRDRHPQVFCADAVVDGALPVRFYDVGESRVAPVAPMSLERASNDAHATLS